MNKLKDYIHNSKVNKSELCRKAKISRPTLDNLISNDPRYTPSLSTIQKVCKALNLSWKDYV